MPASFLPGSSKEGSIGPQLAREVWTDVIGIASVTETKTSVESCAEVIVARGSDQGLRFVYLRHRSCANPERVGESCGESSFRRVPGDGNGSWEVGIIRRIGVGAPAAVGSRVREV